VTIYILEAPVSSLLTLQYFKTMPKLTYPIAFILLLCSNHTLYAQETTSEIVGVITDDKGPLTGSVITATHLPTGTSYVATSRLDGRYNLDNMKIGGPYSVTVSFVGYKAQKKENIMLLIGQEYKADFTLTPESKELDVVTVQSAHQGKVFNSNHTGPQEIITREHLQDLPTIDRSIGNFTTLMPSANNFNFGGSSALYSNITLDGANFFNVFGLVSNKQVHLSGQPLSIEAIEQIQINAAPYDVRQGGFAGSNINIVSRSGTNDFKGSAYVYYNGPGTTGYKVGNTELPDETFSYYRPGFFASGPIIKNKLFFLISADRENFSAPASAFTASDATHPPGGNVSAANADKLNELRQFLINNYNYDPGEYQGYKLDTRKDRVSAKIDWNIDTNSTFTFKYNFYRALNDQTATNNLAPGGNRQAGPTGLPFSSSGYTDFNDVHNFLAELNTNWRGKAANKLQVGYLSVRSYRESMGKKDFPFVDILDEQKQSYTSFGFEPSSYHNFIYVDIAQIADAFTLYKGLHEINFGTQSFIKRYRSGFAPYNAGVYRFNSLDSFYASAEDGNPNSSAYFLQYTVTKDHTLPVSKVNIDEFAFFVQDKLRFRNKLIFTYGFRIDIPVYHHTFVANDHVASLTFRDGTHYDIGKNPDTNPLISPRISFNWDLTKNVQTQLRGGAGLFAGAPPFLWLGNASGNNSAQFGSLITRNNAFSPDLDKYRPKDSGAATTYDLSMIPQDFKYPQVFKSNIAIDRSLPGDITATLEASYSKNIVAVFFQNVNLPSTGTAFQGSDNRIRFDSTQINSGYPSPTPENPNIQTAILMDNTRKGYAYTITLQLQKRITDFYFGAAYTYSKSKTVNDGGALQPNIWSNRPVTGDPNSEELGFADFNQPHRVIAYGSFRKDYAKYFATTISFIFEAAPSAVGSYTYLGDVNNDGALNDNDLIYIPKDKDDIVLVPVYTGWGLPITDRRTPDQIWAQLDNYIRQDDYLSSHRGQYAERNAVVLPFYKRLDLNITQEITLGKGKHTIELSFDLINVGNFLNKKWGTYKTFTYSFGYPPFISPILQYEGIVQDGEDKGKPRYSFPYLDATNEIPITNSFKDDTSIYSRWQGQFGIRYIFR
jgi:hypothetical protein